VASKEDKLLSALRSLSPPKGGSGELPQVRADPPPSTHAERDDDVPRERRHRTLQLSLEEVGAFFLAAAVLLVLAFLMGWYGRGVALPGGGSGETGSGHGRREGLPSLFLPDGRTDGFGKKPSGVRPSSSRRIVFTILAAKFPGSGSSEAAHYVAFLKENGFVPAFLRPTRDEANRSCIELCVGRFASQRDQTLNDWLPRVRRLRGAFAKAIIARIPE
jgi:hypothetical protein